ncbi:MAG TPA: outer membrane lipoprotein chaperone LolA [Terriglobales bacterium]|nr:outer membrane lipoprotein chaperone LolA [Terriglobales bacterium]
MNLKAIAHAVLSAIALSVIAIAAFGLPSVKAVAHQVDEKYNHLQTLEADFIEIYQGVGAVRSESGKLWLKKPGKMRWEYRSPEEKLFVADGHTGWLYLPLEKQVRKSSMKSLDDLRSPLAFLLGKTKLEKELFGLSFAPDIETWHTDDMILRGVPAALSDRISEVLLEITPEHQIARILIHSVDDSTTEYRFSNQKENINIPDSQFRFTPAPGTEVIDEQTGN